MQTIIWAGVALTDAFSAAQTDYAVCVEATHIIATGPRKQLQAQYPNATQIGGDHYLLIPTFTNSHDHGRGLGTFPLGAPDDLLEIWLPGLYSQPAVDPFLLSLWEGIQLLHAGVTLTAHSHNPQSWQKMEQEAELVLRGYGEAGIRVAFHPPLVDQNPLIYADRERFLAGVPSTVAEAAQRFLGRNPLSHADYYALCHRLYEHYHDTKDHTVHIQISPAGGQWCSDELILGAVEFAQSHQTRVQMHMLETAYQRYYAWRKWGKSFIAHLEEIDALGPWLTLAHMIWTNPEDLPLLQRYGVGIAHNPSSNLRLRSGVAPIPAYLEQKIALGIGLDGQTLDDDQDYLREMRLAWTLANRPGAASPTISASQIFHMGTRNGASITYGPEVQLGVLAAGALADLLLVDYAALRHPWGAPTVPVVDMLLRKGARQHVRQVMMGGEWVIRDGSAVRVNEDEVASALADQLHHYDADTLKQRNAAALAVAPYLRRFYAAWEENASDDALQRQMFF
jgi:cytosine/adenosine deaminase-related metal-dependent hydrolase